jgi:outer membrane receptor for ferrienterochelin and colicins
VQAEIDGILPRVAVIEVGSDPPGATVFLDQRELGAVGVTPFQVALEPGGNPRRLLFEREGHAPAELELAAPQRGTRQTVSAALTAFLGTVDVEAEPGITIHQGAPDGPLLCTTPCDPKLPPGPRVLWFRRDGYRDTARQLEIIADGVVSASVQLQPITGSVLVDATERGALVEIDGEAVGFTPTVVQGVAVGERTVRVSRRGYLPVEQAVDVPADGQIALEGLALVPVNEVTAVSRRAESVALAPSSVTLISRDELEAFRYPTIYEALRGVRGMALTDDSVYAAAAVRGLGQPGDYGNRLLVLQDGATLNDAILYQSFITYDGRIDLGGVDRIEVVRGPGSVLYGTGAVSGVVNLIGDGLDAPEGAQLAVGTFDDGVVRGRGQVQVKTGDRSGFRASVSGATSQGRDEVFELRDGTEVALERVETFHGATTSGRIWAGDATLQWFATTRSVGIPTGASDALIGTLDGNRWVDQRAMIEARFEPALSQKVRLLARTWVYLEDFEGLGNYGATRTVERYGNLGGGVEVRVIAEPSPAFRLQAGATVDANPKLTLKGEDRAVGEPPEVYLDASAPNQIAAAYAVIDLTPVDAVHVTAGARLDWWSTFGAAVSPRLAVVLTPTERDVLKLIGGRAFRAPSPYELTYAAPDVQYTPASQGIDLQPETVWSGEVEASHAFDAVWTGLIAGHLSVADALVETVAAPEDPNASTLRNADQSVRILGADAELRRAFRGGWMASAQYGLLDARYAGGERTPNAPTHQAGVKLIAPIAAPTARIAFRTALEAPRRLDLTNDDTTGWAVIGDLVLSGSVPDRGLDYAVGVYNLFDQRYAQPAGDGFPFRAAPQAGRSLMAELSLRL